MATALIVDNDSNNLLSLAEVFRAHGYSTETAQNLSQAREALLRRMPDVAMISEEVGSESSLELLNELDLSSVMEIYLMSAERKLDTATRAMRLGVTDYFGKPVDRERLASNLEHLASATGTETEFARSLGADKSGRGMLVGESLPMQRLYRLIRKCAPSDAAILLVGESGTGKEIVAHTVHQLSPRAKGECVELNCSALTPELMESELFGHRKGSFTGATRDHKGYFERANGGTLFLDEITEMPVSLQAKLLRALESKSVQPVGAEETVETDVRIIAATNRDPDEAIEHEALREDLYYRLAQFPMRVPPLRERSDDVGLLAEHFLAAQNAQTGIDKEFDEAALEALRLHDWPGNVRELKNAVIHGHLLAGKTITIDDLPDGVPSNRTVRGQNVRVQIGMSLAEVERRHLLSTLAHFEGDKKKAAEVLGVSLKTLYNRLKRYRTE